MAYLKSKRLINGCIGLNFCIAPLSICALFAVAKRRLEFFTVSQLLLFSLTSTAVAFGELLPTTWMFDKVLIDFDMQNLIGGPLVLLIVI